MGIKTVGTSASCAGSVRELTQNSERNLAKGVFSRRHLTVLVVTNSVPERWLSPVETVVCKSARY